MTDITKFPSGINMPLITLADVEDAIQRKKRRKFFTMFPDDGSLRRELYVPHMEFLKATASFTEVAFIAGNRTGKSETVTYAGTAFATGEYPPWWDGRVFRKATNIIAAGETAKLVRDSLQEKFLGPPNDIGTGMIPFENIIERRAKSGIPDAVDTVRIRHKTGDTSTIRFMSYDQGREAFQATAQDVIILDEEPPEDIYMECMTRLMTTGGLLMAAFTPLRGITGIVQSFMPSLGREK